MGGALSSVQLLIVGGGLLAFGLYILAGHDTMRGLLLCGIGALMLGKRFFAN